MLTKLRAGLAAVAVAGAMLVPVATATTATAAVHATAHCAHHTVGTCRAGDSHPRGAMARCKDWTYSYSQHFSGTCSHHRGVRYWYK